MNIDRRRVALTLTLVAISACGTVTSNDGDAGAGGMAGSHRGGTGGGSAGATAGAGGATGGTTGAAGVATAGAAGTATPGAGGSATAGAAGTAAGGAAGTAGNGGASGGSGGAAACSTTHLVISEIRSRGAAGASDEFVELYNPTNVPVTLDASWTLDARSNTATVYSARWTGTGKVIPAHGHFLLATTGYTQTPAADEMLATGITDATSLRLMHSASLVDAVCYGFDATTKMSFTTDTTFSCEGAPATNLQNNTTSTNVDTSIERKPGAASGNCTDTGDNDADFAQTTPANPQNTVSPPTP